MAFPDYTISVDTSNGSIDERSLHQAIVDAGPYSEVFDGIRVRREADTFKILMIEPIAGDVTTIEGVLAAHAGPTTLDLAKAVKAAEIDDRTRHLIADGFEFPALSGVRYSLSNSAQRSLTAAYAFRADLSMSYPVVWNSIDDKTTTTLLNASDMRDFYFAGLAHVRAQLDSGTVLKDAVRAAADQAALDAIADTR